MELLPIVGFTCWRFSIDHRVTLLFLKAESSYELVLGNKFVVKDESDNVFIVDIANDITTILPALKLLFRVVTSVTVDTTGELTVNFEDSITLQVEPNGNYEPWEMTGSNGYLVVCTPDGEIVTWSAPQNP